MKTAFSLLFFVPFGVFAQSPVTANPGSAATLPSSACLSCAGATWSNETNVLAADGAGADVGLMQNGFCFQSSCYASRYMEASVFGFNIPLTATIDSIHVDVTRKGLTAQGLHDSIVQLEPDPLTGPVGTNMADPATVWPAAYATKTYGQPGDPLWGYAWTPAMINNAQFGVLVKVSNGDASQQTAYIDHIAVTIHYSTSTGIFSATSSPGNFQVLGSGTAHPVLELKLERNAPVKFTVTDVAGRVLYEKQEGMLSPGVHRLQPAAEEFPAGLYFLVAEADGKRFAGRWMKTVRQ